MYSLPRPQFNRLASLAIVMLLSACGGGGMAGQSSTPGPAAAPAPAAAASDVPLPQLASVPAQLPWNDPILGGYTVIAAAAPTDTGGEAPYPDLRMLPTRTMAFEPVVYGDVADVAVTSAP